MDIVRPAMRFDEVISTYGYPLIGKEVAEAIYYARRIRSQSLNVERERADAGTARRTTRSNRSNDTSGTNLPGAAPPADNASGEEITERLQWGGIARQRIKQRHRRWLERKIISSRQALQGTDEQS